MTKTLLFARDPLSVCSLRAPKQTDLLLVTWEMQRRSRLAIESGWGWVRVPKNSVDLVAEIMQRMQNRTCGQAEDPTQRRQRRVTVAHYNWCAASVTVAARSTPEPTRERQLCDKEHCEWRRLRVAAVLFPRRLIWTYAQQQQEDWPPLACARIAV